MVPSVRAAAAALAALAVVALATTADAQKRQKVRIETEPEGAAVYLGDKDGGAAGETPLDLDLPAGEHILIVELDGHLPLFETIVVERRTGKAARSPQTFRFELPLATATLVVEAGDGGLPDGTRVLVDGEDAGAPPVRVEVAAGAHQVQVVAPGRPPWEQWVEVEGGQALVVEVGRAQLGEPARDGADRPPPRPRPRPRGAAGPAGTLRAGVEVGWRRYRYEDPRTPNLRPYEASGTVMFAVEAELHPWRRLAPGTFLDRLAIVGGAGLAPPIVARDDRGNTVEAYWRQQHAALRMRAAPHRALAVDVDAGWVHLLYTFLDDGGGLAEEVPDVDYHMVRIGARLVARPGGGLEAWLGADNRIVVAAGKLADRFRGADVDGVGARAGVAYRLLGGHVEARVEGTLTRLGWTFQAESGDSHVAAGGTDLLLGVTATLGGTY